MTQRVDTIFLFVLIASAGFWVRAGDLILLGVSVADDPVRTLYPNGRSFSQNAIDSFAGFQYVTHWDAEDRLCVARRELPDGLWEIIRFEDYHIEGGDAHETTVLGICPLDGTLHLAFDHHNDPLHYRVSVPNVATDPTSITWSPALFGPVQSELVGTPIVDVTYPRFITTPSGALQLWFRIGVSGDGDNHFYRYDPFENGWSFGGVIISGIGFYQGSTSRNAYLNGLHFGPSGCLHTTFCWREFPDVHTNHDINYAYSTDEGASWFQNQDQLLALPIYLDSPGLIVWPIPMYQGLLNTCGQAVDPSGRMHTIFVHHDTGAYTHYWRQTDGSWQINPIPYFGGRPKLVFDDQNDIYIVCPGLAILSATEQTAWTDWKLVHDPWITDQPLPEPALDESRWKDEAILSVYHQRGSELQVLDFQRAENILIFRDGFEGGDTTSWTMTVPPTRSGE